MSLYKLIDQTYDNHEPTLIKGKRHNALLVSEEDWSAIQETAFSPFHSWHAGIHSGEFSNIYRGNNRKTRLVKS